mmetsp:Transcript_39392/g.47772  ORF Transcript_39392/g.47772 Transcript_39392/m.47772 type:complete len:214 (+) Transcript_39392:515-1156(+)
MFTCQVTSPLNNVLKFIPKHFLHLAVLGMLNQHLHSFCVRDSLEGSTCHHFASIDTFFIIHLLKELHIVHAGLQQVFAAELNIFLRALHVIVDISKCNLRLDHPKLCQVAGCVAVLSSKCWTKSVHITHSAGKGLHLELTGHCKECLLAKEVFLIVNPALWCTLDATNQQRLLLRFLLLCFESIQSLQSLLHRLLVLISSTFSLRLSLGIFDN